MEREIKFRAWDGEHLFYDWGNISSLGNAFYRFYCPETEITKMGRGYDLPKLSNFEEKYIFMQYTGLKDKNDVEIYEGDVCRCWGGSEFNGCYEYNKIYEVKWQGSGLEMMINDCGYGWNYSSGFEYIEVIGNIYEDSHLLDNN